MKKIIFGIFAHPDDEAFGPSASLYNAVQNGTDVHLILVTDGEAGTNTDNVSDLGTRRLQEWQESRKCIGATSGLALHYPDGGLCNDMYLEIANKCLEHIKQILTTYTEPVSVDFMTFDNDGISGHLDHIAVSFITTFVYLKLRDQSIPKREVSTLKYYCLPEETFAKASTSWLYMAKGKDAASIDEIFDYTALRDKKIEIMKKHYSQRSDMEQILKRREDNPVQASHCDHFRYFKA